MSMLEVLRTV